MINGNKIFSAEDISAAVEKIASAIGAEFKGDFSNCALVGIHQQGVPCAQLICRELQKKYGSSPVLGKLDISMYRDDIGNNPRSMCKNSFSSVSTFGRGRGDLFP